MDVMKVNFQSFLLTDGLIYVGVVLSTVIAGQQRFPAAFRLHPL